MSEYYYITRNSRPLAKDGHIKITEAEWRSAVASVPELVIDQTESSNPHNASSEVWAIWHSYPGGYPAWFVLSNDGDVELKSKYEDLFGKFKQLASVLGARIFSETGEEFT